jgi:hypothetical protein
MILRNDDFDDDLLMLLEECGEELPERLRVEVTAYGERGVGPLCALLDADGWGPVHAVRLMREMGAAGAIGPLIDALCDTEPDDPLHGEVHTTLAAAGAAAIGPLIARFPDVEDDSRACIVAILIATRVRDDRILDVLLDMLETGDPVFAAESLADYGDARALSSLVRRLDRIKSTRTAFLNDIGLLIALVDAIECLGGRPSGERSTRLVPTGAEAAPAIAEPVPLLRRAARPGRNEPCWCGSGVKYKRCHLEDDARADGAGPGSRLGAVDHRPHVSQ